MRHLTLLLPALLLLSACSSTGQSLSENLKNPLFAEYYYQDLATTLADVEINATLPGNAALLKDPARKALLEQQKTQATQNASTAQKVRDRASTGDFVSANESEQGTVMLVDGTLFTNPAFNSPAGPSLHIFLTTVIDPTDKPSAFPDSSALDLGLVNQPYGTSSYTLPSGAAKTHYRTVVLYDTMLRSIYGFAQLSDGPDVQFSEPSASTASSAPASSAPASSASSSK